MHFNSRDTSCILHPVAPPLQSVQSFLPLDRTSSNPPPTRCITHCAPTASCTTPRQQAARHPLLPRSPQLTLQSRCDTLHCPHATTHLITHQTAPDWVQAPQSTLYTAPEAAQPQVYTTAPQYPLAPPPPPPPAAPAAASGGFPWYVWVGVGIFAANIGAKVCAVYEGASTQTTCPLGSCCSLPTRKRCRRWPCSK